MNFVSLVTPNIRLRARAGSGKSTAIVIKCNFLVNSLGVAPEAIQVLTFNKSAAEDLSLKLKRSRGDEIGRRVSVNTFHSLAYAVLRNCHETRGVDLKFSDAAFGQSPQFSDLDEAVLSTTTQQDIDAYERRYQGSEFGYLANDPNFDNSVREFAAGASSLYRARRGTPNAAKSSAITAHLGRVVDAYDAHLAKINALDGEAGLRKAGEIMKGNADFPRFTRLNGALQYLFVASTKTFRQHSRSLRKG